MFQEQSPASVRADRGRVVREPTLESVHTPAICALAGLLLGATLGLAAAIPNHGLGAPTPSLMLSDLMVP